MYATSDVYDPAGPGNVDLDGVIFPDMPWVLDPLGVCGGRARLGRARVPQSRRPALAPLRLRLRRLSAWSTSCRACAAATPGRCPALPGASPWTRRVACAASSTGRRSSAGASRPGRRCRRRCRRAREHGAASRARPRRRGGCGAPPRTPGLPDGRDEFPRQGRRARSRRAGRRLRSQSSRSATAPRDRYGGAAASITPASAAASSAQPAPCSQRIRHWPSFRPDSTWLKSAALPMIFAAT